MSDSVPILMYHQVTPRPVPPFDHYSVTPEVFARQIRLLRRAGYVAVTPDALIQAREGTIALPRRPVVITFDDGYEESAEYAAPILRENSFTAIFYVVAGLIGKPSAWLLRELNLQFPIMSWATARSLEAMGMHLGSHTVSHPRLASLARDACIAELRQSRQLLEDGLGHEVLDFAYPFGSFNASVLQMANEVGYRAACTTVQGRSRRSDNRLALRRLPVYGNDPMYNFVSRVLTGKPLRTLLRTDRVHLPWSGHA